jgi:hypothetical protein
MGILDRWTRGVNAFRESETTDPIYRPNEMGSYGTVASARPYQTRTSFSNERSIISSIYARISIDAAAIDIRHCRTDDQGRYMDDIDSGLQNCLTIEANIDQGATAFLQDVFMTLCDKGYLAIVPVDTTTNPKNSMSYDILTMRVGEIVKWHPRHVRVSVYDDEKGIRQELTLPKTQVAVVENPLYSVMNEPNSTLQRLIRKLNLLDTVDEASASGKLDLLVQLPYTIKSETRRQQAQQRRDDIEFQLKGSKYGIAYIDGTEKVTQLNRPVENNLMSQIEYLIKMLYGQLGLTEEIINGTADEATMLNYHNRTIKPIVKAVVEAMKRTFLTKTARSQFQSILFFRDPFALMPMEKFGDLADKLARNEVLTSNELRQAIGIRPAKDPKADQLINSNMPTSDTGVPIPGGASPPDPATNDTVIPPSTKQQEGDSQNGS